MSVILNPTKCLNLNSTLSSHAHIKYFVDSAQTVSQYSCAISLNYHHFSLTDAPATTENIFLKSLTNIDLFSL
jgi:hypothetical protein